MPLASYRDSLGSLAPLTKHSFLKWCNTILTSLGYGCFSGHCFRISGTTELLVRGVNPNVVHIMGRWSSNSFLCYWHNVSDIAALHVEMMDDDHLSGRRSGVVGVPAAGGSPSGTPQIGVCE